jgi:plastocyanin
MFTRVPFRVAVVAAGLSTAFIFGCSDSTKPPAGPSAVAPSVNGASAAATGSAIAALTPKSAGGQTQRTIDIFDACDPDTFNAAFGAGTCVRNGGLPLNSFIEVLRSHHSAGAWHFTPPQAQLAVGDVLLAVNHGGETHTFTEVEEFGGGINPILNDLTGLTTVAPECNAAKFIPAGGSSSEVENTEGVEKYQCCIHPWMRAEIRTVKR